MIAQKINNSIKFRIKGEGKHDSVPYSFVKLKEQTFPFYIW